MRGHLLHSRGKVTAWAMVLMATFWIAGDCLIAGTLEGRVLDPTGRAIPGAVIEVVQIGETVRRFVSDEQGEYLFASLVPGIYTVRTSAKGFETREEQVIVEPSGEAVRLQTMLRLMVREEEITVRPGAAFSLSLGARRISEGDLSNLPQSSGGLGAVLKMLAPASTPSGPQIVVDGFRLGRDRLPLRDSIREIRVSENPYSAEFSEPGSERVEILTRPGWDRMRGGAFFGFNDESVNSRNPFAAERIAFQSRLVSLDFGGPIVKERSSFLFDFERFERDDNAVIRATVLDPDLRVREVGQAVAVPWHRTFYGARLDVQLNDKNTFVVRYRGSRIDSANQGVGGFSLTSRAFEDNSYEHVFQMTETAIFSPTLMNESRLEFGQSRQTLLGDTSIPTLEVPNAFTGGGSGMGRSFTDVEHWNAENLTALWAGRHAIKLGAQIGHQRVIDSSTANFGGTYLFGGGVAPRLNQSNEVVLDESGQPILEPITNLERYRRTLLFQQQQRSPEEIRRLGGGPTQLSLAGGWPEVHTGQDIVGVFVQDDWSLLPTLDLNLGVRYEWQREFSGDVDVGPRLGLAWSPDFDGASPDLVVRAGFGVFYERLSTDLTLRAKRFETRQQFVTSDPAVLDRFPEVPSSEDLADFSIPTEYRIADDLRAPYTMEGTLKVEKRFSSEFTVSGSVVRSRTLHALRSRNVNAPLNGVRPLARDGEVFQYESSGVVNQSRLILTLVHQMARRFSWYGTYTLGEVRSDTDGPGTFPMDSHSLAGEHGRSSLDIRHTFYWGAWFTAPWDFNVAPLIVARSGVPFNITTGRDDNRDQRFTERPAFATDLTRPGVVRTRFGNFDLDPLPGQAIVPRNFGEGPIFVNVDLLLTRRIQMAGDSPAAIGFSVQVETLLNRLNPGSPVGNLSSPLFGSSTGSAGAFGFGRNPGGNRTLTGQIYFRF